MLERSEGGLIETILHENGLSEQDCLSGLTEQQIRVWVKYALLLETPEEIRREMFAHRKTPNDSIVMYTLADASLRILANILQDADLVYEVQQKPRLRARVQRLIDRVKELRKKKGAKIKCRDRV